MITPTRPARRATPKGRSTGPDQTRLRLLPMREPLTNGKLSPTESRSEAETVHRVVSGASLREPVDREEPRPVAPQSSGGRGAHGAGGPLFDWNGMPRRSDLATIRRAIRGGWKVPAHLRPAIVAFVNRALDSGRVRLQIACAEVIAAMVAADRDELQAGSAGDV